MQLKYIQRKQIEEYAKFEEIKEIQNLNKYTVVAVNDKIYVEKIQDSKKIRNSIWKNFLAFIFKIW